MAEQIKFGDRLFLSGDKVVAQQDVLINRDLVVEGNLDVNGSITTIDTTNTYISDPIVEMNHQFEGSPTDDVGFEVNRGDELNVFWLWDESIDSWSSRGTDLKVHNFHATGNTQINGTLDVDGQSTLASANIEDLTNDRIVLAGVDGELEDDANFTMDGTTFNIGLGNFTVDIATGDTSISGNVAIGGDLDIDGQLTAASLNVEDLTNNRVVIVGVDGELEDDANFVYDGTGLNIGSSNFLVQASSGDIYSRGTIHTDGQATFASANVEDLTDNRIVISGTLGELEDDANFTFDGTTFNIGQGNFTVDVATGNTNSSGQSTLASLNVEDLTDDRIVIAGALGELEDDANFTFNGSKFNIGLGNFTVGVATGNTQVIGALDVDSQSTLASVNVEDLTDNRIVIVGTNGELEDDPNFTMDGALFNIGQGNMTVDVLSGRITSLGQSTLASVNVEDLTDNRVLIAGTNGEIEDDANLTFDGNTLHVGPLIPAMSVNIGTYVTTVFGELDVDGQANLASAAVEDLTDNRVVVSGVGGELEDDANFTFDGTALDIGQGNFTIDVATGNTDISGNLNVQGTLTTLNTETILLADNIVTLNSNYVGSSPNENAGIEVNRGTESKVDVRWNETTDIWEFTNDGTIYRPIPHTTDDLLEGATNLYYLDSRARLAMSVTDTGGDGSLTYDNTTGVITYTGPSAIEVRAHISHVDTGGDGSFTYDSNTGVMTYTGASHAEAIAHFTDGKGIQITDDGSVSTFALDFTEFSTSDVVEDPAATTTSGTMYFTESRSRESISHVDGGGDGSFTYDNVTGVMTYTGPSANETRAHFSATTAAASTTTSLTYDSNTGTFTYTPLDIASVETTTSISFNNATNTLSYIDEDGVQTDIDLTLYLDDTNLARLTQGVLDSNTGIATFTRDDNTTFTVDFSSLLNTDTFVVSGSFDTTTGNLTLTRNDSSTVVTSLDGRYLQSFTETDPIFSASDAAGITSTDISNWNTAHGWGDHSTAGYLTSYTETDPIFSASDAAGITSTDISNWNTAHGWGDHSTAGYLTSYTETDPIFSASEAASITATDTTNWDTAHGWGDHSTAGYLSSTITTSGEGITWSMNTDGASIKFYNTSDGDTDSRLEFSTNDNNDEYFRWTHAPSGGTVYESMRLVPNSDGDARLTLSGDLVVNASQSVDPVATFTGTSSTTDNPIIVAATNSDNRDPWIKLVRPTTTSGADLVIRGGVGSDWLSIHHISSGADSQLVVHSNGNVGVGTGTTTVPAEKLHVGGNIVATGDITAFYSDERLKDFSGKIDNALEKVSMLNGYYYTGNEVAAELGYDTETRQVGVSAQEVESVLPEVVKTAPISLDGETDYKTVQYEKLVPLLIESIKELKAEIEELKRKS